MADNKKNKTTDTKDKDTKDTKDNGVSKRYRYNENVANYLLGGASLVEGFFDIINTYKQREGVRLTNKQLETQKTLIDANLKNNIALANENFRNNVADLQVLMAAKNVDISSQALRSNIVGSGEDLGKDIALSTSQSKLQKLAIDLQILTNKANQRQAEKQSWMNMAGSALKAAAYFI